jgi:hypothetical protein
MRIDDMNKTTAPEIAVKPRYADLLKGELARHRAVRDDAHSIEVRQVVALEQIADELTALRIHLVGLADEQPSK